MRRQTVLPMIGDKKVINQLEQKGERPNAVAPEVPHSHLPLRTEIVESFFLFKSH